MTEDVKRGDGGGGLKLICGTVIVNITQQVVMLPQISLLSAAGGKRGWRRVAGEKRGWRGVAGGKRGWRGGRRWKEGGWLQVKREDRGELQELKKKNYPTEGS